MEDNKQLSKISTALCESTKIDHEQSVYIALALEHALTCPSFAVSAGVYGQSILSEWYCIVGGYSSPLAAAPT